VPATLPDDRFGRLPKINKAGACAAQRITEIPVNDLLIFRGESRVSNIVFERFKEAYRQMAKVARYRPAAPSDGYGNITVELNDPDDLEKESWRYAKKLYQQDENGIFEIYGCSNFSTNRALVYVLEAAKNLCAGDDDAALKLLDMAITDIKIKEPSET